MSRKVNGSRIRLTQVLLVIFSLLTSCEERPVDRANKLLNEGILIQQKTTEAILKSDFKFMKVMAEDEALYAKDLNEAWIRSR